MPKIVIVITKMYDLILWSCNHTGKFLRNHRFVLGERIERNLYDLLEILIKGASSLEVLTRYGNCGGSTSGASPVKDLRKATRAEMSEKLRPKRGSMSGKRPSEVFEGTPR